MIPISRRYVGRSVTRRPSMAISPLSGIRKPATRLRSVVLPQPEGPSRVINSPRRTSSDTLSSAVMSPKRLVTPSSSTATGLPFGCVAAGMKGGRSAGMLNVQHLCKAEEGIGERQHRRRDHNVYDRDRGHRGVRILTHVVVKGNRQRLSALHRDEQRGSELVERQDRGEQPAAD